MRLQEMVEHLWKSQRGLLILLGTLLVLSLLSFAVFEQWLVPQVAEQESRFLQRQTEVRQLMREQGRTAITPEQLYVLASQDTIKI